MPEVLLFMFRLSELKNTARKGWNMDFEEGHKFKRRRVPNSESTADHSWALAMLAWQLGSELGLDVAKLMMMALVHDFAEAITGDTVPAALSDEERAAAKAEKHRQEDAAMHELVLPLGEWGRRAYELWLEYEAGESEEARFLKQLDKLEACAQAIYYKEQGYEVELSEFLDIDYVNALVKHPVLVDLLQRMRERAA